MQDFKHLENPVEPPLYLEDVLGMAGLALLFAFFVFLDPIMQLVHEWLF